MSEAADIRDEGLDVLLDLDAESLTVPGRNNLTVSGIVNRNPTVRPDVDPYTMRFAPTEQTVIWIKRAAVSPILRTGERLVDSFGHNHVVKKIEILGDVVSLSCATTPSTVGS